MYALVTGWCVGLQPGRPVGHNIDCGWCVDGYDFMFGYVHGCKRTRMSRFMNACVYDCMVVDMPECAPCMLYGSVA